MDRACSTKKKTNAHRILAGKSERTISVEGARLKWEGNIKMGLTGREWGGVYWIELAQDSDQWTESSVQYNVDEFLRRLTKKC
jgi:hypothetical protein